MNYIKSKHSGLYSLQERINITKRLIEGKKLDSKIGKVAINHFETHLKELADIRK